MLSSEIKHQMLAVYLLKQELPKLKKQINVEDVIPFEIFQKLTWLLVSTENELIMYDVSWILIEVTHASNAYSSFLANPEVIKPIFDLVARNTVLNITNHLIFIFANLLNEPEPIPQQIIANTDIIGYTLHTINQEETPLFLRHS